MIYSNFYIYIYRYIICALEVSANPSLTSYSAQVRVRSRPSTRYEGSKTRATHAIFANLLSSGNILAASQGVDT